jgi:predicted PurR-regulated permease PerM
MEFLNNIASKVQLSAKNLLYLVLGLVAVFFVLGSPKRVYRRARKATRRVASTTRRTYTRARGYVRRYATRKTR